VFSLKKSCGHKNQTLNQIALRIINVRNFNNENHNHINKTTMSIEITPSPVEANFTSERLDALLFRWKEAKLEYNDPQAVEINREIWNILTSQDSKQVSEWLVKYVDELEQNYMNNFPFIFHFVPRKDFWSKLSPNAIRTIYRVLHETVSAMTDKELRREFPGLVETYKSL
jgi:hypothetical protein